MSAHKLKLFYERILFSNKVYRAFLRPFDRRLYPLVDWRELAEERARGRVPLNKVPHVADLCNPEWRAILDDMAAMFPMDAGHFHRKVWEFCHIVYALKRAGVLHPANQGLAVGAGREQILYYLAHKVRRMVAVDLYQGSYLGGEDEPDIPEHPDKYAPFLYPRENLSFQRMDALDLQFPGDSFDFVFSASSIEHFGAEAQIARSLAEMHRVLKPGGVCVITSEIRLNRLAGRVPHTRLFAADRLLDLFRSCGFVLVEEGLDLRLEDHYWHNWVKLPQEVFKTPHVILRFLNSVFTSLALAFRKPGDRVRLGPWREGCRFSPLAYAGELRVDAPATAPAGPTRLPVEISLANRGNFTWYGNGWSHRIAVAVKLLDESGGVLDPGLGDIAIPGEVVVGQTLSFRAELPLCLKPGRYRLFFDLKREMVTWFHEKGSRPAIVPLHVVQAGSRLG